MDGKWMLVGWWLDVASHWLQWLQPISTHGYGPRWPRSTPGLYCRFHQAQPVKFSDSVTGRRLCAFFRHLCGILEPGNSWNCSKISVDYKLYIILYITLQTYINIIIILSISDQYKLIRIYLAHFVTECSSSKTLRHGTLWMCGSGLFPWWTCCELVAQTQDTTPLFGPNKCLKRMPRVAVFRCCAGGICWHMLALHGHLVYLVARWIKLRFRKVWQWVTSCRIYEIRPGAGFLDGFEQVENVGRDLSLGPGGCMRFPMDFPQHLCSPCIYLYDLVCQVSMRCTRVPSCSTITLEPNFESRKAKNIPIMWHLQVSVLWNLKIFHKRLIAHFLFFSMTFHDCFRCLCWDRIAREFHHLPAP